MYRTTPVWYRDGMAEILILFSQSLTQNRPSINRYTEEQVTGIVILAIGAVLLLIGIVVWCIVRRKANQIAAERAILMSDLASKASKEQQDRR